MLTTIHPWHIPIGDLTPSTVRVVIEIPKGTRTKYELDKSTGLLKLDRVLYSAMYYPMNYGLIPRTWFEDGDPLDILVMCSQDIEPLCVVDTRVVGIMHMEDEHGTDDKIIGVAAHDPAYAHIHDLPDIPKHHMAELQNFFASYKTLENKKVNIGGLYGREKAYACIRQSMQAYRDKFKE